MYSVSYKHVIVQVMRMRRNRQFQPCQTVPCPTRLTSMYYSCWRRLSAITAQNITRPTTQNKLPCWTGHRKSLILWVPNDRSTESKSGCNVHWCSVHLQFGVGQSSASSQSPDPVELVGSRRARKNVTSDVLKQL